MKDKDTPVTISAGGKEIKTTTGAMKRAGDMFKKEEPKELIQVSKVKFDGKEVKINYSMQIKEGENVNCEYVCKDLPHPDFEDAIECLVEPFRQILEFPEHYMDKLGIRGMSIKLSDFLVKEGVTITGLKELSSGKFVCLNTPYLAFDDENYEMPSGLLERVADLSAEALKYIEGKREVQQLKLCG